MFLTEEDYKTAYDLVPRLCVDLIFHRGTQILLVKRKQKPYIGSWHLPGGCVRLRESLENAANRISQAELGIKLKVIRSVGYIEFLNDVGDLGDFHSVSIPLVVIPLTEPAIPDAVWWGEEPENMHPAHKQFLDQYHWTKDRVNATLP
jgi:ADP-ribose pyrophosphatase YjhB (NUDIX family)